ncbi:uncharacterized protein LOC124459283 isoform X1 [Xenia sp. Carnegie-2017]|uniref:uncharacterized protein LOC124459283 isoform X1 n=1 Tax=Xenia sp. Carnegie-2017 TaxID=2897299 RepID=UPI001F046B19|nr:uncharacterized protein LOC124459283 isoform X1 [Xenia sp. Carnegie-2017]
MNGQNKSWGLGLVYDVARTEKYSQGSNQEWYSFKNRILEHVNCSSMRNAGQFHMKALQYHLSQKPRKERNIDTNVKLVYAGIEICKIKTAALLYESLVAFLSFCGVDVGTIGHGRYVCQLPHVMQLLDDQPLLKLLPHNSDNVLEQFKETVMRMVWEGLGNCRSYVFIDEKHQPVTEFEKEQLISLKCIEDPALDLWFTLKFSSGKAVKATINEEFVYTSMYTNEDIIRSIGQEMCIALDVALSQVVVRL